MKNKIFIILIVAFQLFAQSDEHWIDPNKKAILLDFAQDVDEAKQIAKQYKNHDIYIYNTIQNSNACCAIHIVNLKKSEVKPLLKQVKQTNSVAKEISKTRVRYFARDLSPKNLFIESDNTNNNTLEKKIVTLKQPEQQVIQDTLAQQQDDNWIDPKKKALLIGYAKNPKNANKIAKQYENQDIYIHSTVKNSKSCCAVYIVNIDKQNLTPILKMVSKKTKIVKPISSAKIKYFASDLSPMNKFIAATKTYHKPIKKITQPKKVQPTKLITQKPHIKQPKKVQQTKLVTQTQDTKQKQITQAILKPKKVQQTKLIKTIKQPKININQKAIAVMTGTNLNKVKQYAQQLLTYDRYIYTTTTTKIPYFILYVINIPQDNLRETFKAVKKQFKDSYIVSNKRVKYLSTTNFNKQLFFNSNIQQPIKIKQIKKTKPKITTKPKIITTHKNEIKPQQKQTKQVVTTPQNNNINKIDINKKAITIATVFTLERAKQLAQQLFQYDIYIYKTTTTRVPYYIIYIINIDKDMKYTILKKVKKQFKDAYLSSNIRIKSLAANNFDKNIFIKGTK